MAPKKSAKRKTVRKDSAGPLFNEGTPWSKKDENTLRKMRSSKDGGPTPYHRIATELGRSNQAMRLKMMHLRAEDRKRAAAVTADVANKKLAAEGSLLAPEAARVVAAAAAEAEAGHTLMVFRQKAVRFFPPLWRAGRPETRAVAGTALDPMGALLAAVAPEMKMEDGEETEDEMEFSRPSGSSGAGGAGVGGVVTGGGAGAGNGRVSNIHSLLN